MAEPKAQLNIDPADVKEQMLKIYPPKVARKRAQQIVVNQVDKDENVPEIKANVRTTPGIITQRGCSYAGCKGLTHGPIGCGFYSWLTRRNQTRPAEGEDNFMPYCFSTDMQDEEIIFGGEKKLAKAIQEAYDNFKPKAIGVFATCPVGLIGDDIHQVSKEMKEKLGINVFGFSCEGYKGVSQSAGHHIANNQLFKHVIGEDNTPDDHPFKVTLLGEYNIGGDAFVLEDIFEKCGIKLKATFSGNSTYEGFATAHTSDLNCVMCHRSINYVADMIEKKYGVPWIKVNFIGAEGTAKSLRKIAAYFENDELTARVEKVIAEELVAVKEVQEDVKSRVEGKLSMLFVGGSRAHHYQDLFNEIGMSTVAAGYEFGHRDDYEGRKVLPDIKIDADSRNIEELTVEADPELYNLRKTEAELKALESKGVVTKEYGGLMPEMQNQTLVIDDISQHETEKLLEIYKPAIFCAGIKEKYAVQKSGVPLLQLHSYDYGGPFAGFQGAINFYKTVDRMVSSEIWSKLKAPWQLSGKPMLEAKMISA
ncbi:MAG: nitrogenase component I subunit alpha [Planctomycetota bacterium]|jgi:nitrogenase molybdenum-iron protein alpha chain